MLPLVVKLKKKIVICSISSNPPRKNQMVHLLCPGIFCHPLQGPRAASYTECHSATRMSRAGQERYFSQPISVCFESVFSLTSTFAVFVSHLRTGTFKGHLIC